MTTNKSIQAALNIGIENGQYWFMLKDGDEIKVQGVPGSLEELSKSLTRVFKQELTTIAEEVRREERERIGGLLEKALEGETLRGMTIFKLRQIVEDSK